MKLKNTKVGIIIDGIDSISPTDIVKTIGFETGSKIYSVIIGYGVPIDSEDEYYSISSRIESAVTWRNNPGCAGKILVFKRGDVD